jgi:hypothetical protein
LLAIAFEFNVTLVSLLQLEKALSPMLVTLSGIVTEVRLLQDWNAYLPMLVTLLGMVTLLGVVGPLGLMIVVSLLQPEKA